MRRDRSSALPSAGAAAAVITVVCCAGLPLVGSVLGGLTLAAVLGVSGGLLLAAAVVVVVALGLRSRRRRRFDPDTRRPGP